MRGGGGEGRRVKMTGLRYFLTSERCARKTATSKPNTALRRPRSTPVTGINTSGIGGGGVGAIGATITGAMDEAEEEESELLRDNRILLLRLLTEATLLLRTLEDRILLLDRDETEETDDEVEEDRDAMIEVADDELETLLGTDEAGAAAAQTTMVTVSVVTVPPNAKARPVHTVLAPTVMPASAMTVPAIVVFAASVVACVGVQNTLHADAPLKVTKAPAVDVNAPLALKMNVPLPLSVSGPPIFIAPALQYTPGVYMPTGPCVVSVERLIAPGGNVNVHGSPASADKAVPWFDPASA